MTGKSRKHEPVHVSANLTPMIDVTFLLIVFFILVTQFANVQVAEEIELPEPDQPVSVERDQTARLVINIIPSPSASQAGRVIGYRLGSAEYPATARGISMLSTEIANSAREKLAEDENATVLVDLRADRYTAYGEIYPVMQAVVAAGYHRVNLVVQSESVRTGGR